MDGGGTYTCIEFDHVHKIQCLLLDKSKEVSTTTKGEETRRKYDIRDGHCERSGDGRESKMYKKV